MTPGDEGPHEPVGDGWSESWSFELTAADGTLGGWARLTAHRDHAWYHAMLTGRGRQLLAVVDHEVPHRSRPLEVRTTDLWADHVCETPLDHWTLGLEAFALGVEDPLELYGRQLGDRVPLGFDLEWETDGPVLEAPATDPAVRSYEIPCRVHGEILVGSEEIDFEGVGARDHRWGPVDWWSDDGWHLTGVVEGHRQFSVDQRGGAVHVTVVDREGRVEHPACVASLERDDNGLPTSARVDGDDLALRVEVLAVTPLALPPGGPDRPPARRPRALCRLRADGGWIGVGWLEVRGGAAPLGSG